MSQNPTTPPEISSSEDTPPDSLLARLRKITGVTDPAPLPDKEDLKIADGAPPVDRLIVVLRDGFAVLAAIGIAAGVLAAAGVIWLWGHGKSGAKRTRRWQREMFVRLAAARARRAERVIAPEAATGTGLRKEVTAVEPAPAPAVEPKRLIAEVTEEFVVPLAPPVRARPAKRFRPALISAAAVLLALPALWLVNPVRYYFTSLMGRGNAAVVVGSEGWLFPRAESEPAAVSPPLRETAAALRAHGAALIVVSVPAKSAVYPEKLTGSGGGELQRQPQVGAALKDLTDAGAQVLDLGPVLHALKTSDAGEDFVFPSQSGLWSPRGMSQAAFAAAGFIQQQPGYAALPLQPSLAVMTPATGAATTGDLVSALDSPRLQSRYTARRVPLIRLLNSKTEPLASDAASPVTLLGGECVRLYDDPALGHPAESLSAGQRSSAGFAQHLAWHLSTPLEVQTAGSSLEAAMDWLATRAEADRKSKRVIVWVLSDADLLQ